MLTTATHPTAVVLYAFHSGRLRPAEQSAVEAHVGGCETCAAVLAQLPDGPLVLLAREAVRLTSVAEPTPLPQVFGKPDP